MSHLVDQYFALHAAYLASVAQAYSVPPEDIETVRHAMDGALKLADAIYLHERVQAARPQRILEVGSFLGFSTRWLLEASSGLAAEIVSVDPGLRHRKFDQPRLHLRQFCEPFQSRLNIVDAFLCEKNEGAFMHDYITYEPRLHPRDALARMDGVPVLDAPFGTFDFAFIDGDHSFDATYANVLLVSRMMPGGGVIVVHDAFSHAGVAPALRSVCSDHPRLAFAGIDGTSYHLGSDRIAGLTGRDPAALKDPFCDGLGIVSVQPTHASGA